MKTIEVLYVNNSGIFAHKIDIDKIFLITKQRNGNAMILLGVDEHNLSQDPIFCSESYEDVVKKFKAAEAGVGNV